MATRSGDPAKAGDESRVLVGGNFLDALSEDDRAQLEDVITREWCKPLASAGVRFRVELKDGSAAAVLLHAADEEDADLVVTGRRGRRGFAELLLGSTSHQVSHHLTRPVLIVP